MIPVGDSPRSRTTPWVNYLLILANVAVFIYVLTLSTDFLGGGASVEAANSFCYGLLVPPTAADQFYCEWGFQPREFFDVLRGDAAIPDPDRGTIFSTLISAQFIHAGWLHIIGNLVFLWVFGDNIEDRLGHLPYLAFYLLAGVVAVLAQGVMDTSSVVPVVGASGAVAAVLGAYLFYFPKATVFVVIPFFILIFIPLPIPAVIMIGLWFVQNLFAGIASVSEAADPNAGVAWFAHIGGFAFGFLVAALARKRGKRRPPAWGA